MLLFKRTTDQITLSVELDGKEIARVSRTDLIAAIAATIGPDEWLLDLITAHHQLAHSLYSQNFGAVATEPYDRDDNNPIDGAGVRLEELAGKIINALLSLER